jgi:hypothetical protein
MRNSDEVADFCYETMNDSYPCEWDGGTVTKLECDDGTDCAAAYAPGTFCCAQGHHRDRDTQVYTWDRVTCLPADQCNPNTDDVLCDPAGQNQCPGSMTCTLPLGGLLSACH